MPTREPQPPIIKILLIFRNAEPKTITKAILENTYPNQLKITEIPLLQDAIDCLEKGEAEFDLIFFEHESSTKRVIQTLLDLGGNAKYIMCSSDETFFQMFSNQPEFMLTEEIAQSFYRVLKKFSTSGKLPPLPVLIDEPYVSINPHTLLGGSPLRNDIFVLMAQGRYVCIFRKGEELENADLQKYLIKKTVALFYMKKSDCAAALLEHTAAIERATEKSVITLAEAETTFRGTFDLVRDLVSQIGFTPETQAIARSSINLTLKAMGSSPKLSSILSNLEKRKEGYISSHSFSVGQVACAIAHQIGWNSAGTYYKLTLAAFLHDIIFSDNKLAEVASYEEAIRSGQFTDAELQTILTHPTNGSEHSKQFTEIPADIDQIIAEHHERPDGTGFPNRIPGKTIAPLSALFIMAHDLVNYSKDQPESTIESFLQKNASYYDVGQFKKIMSAL